MKWSTLDRRAVIEIAGPDGRDFLQGLISGDVTKVAPDRAIFAALLTPQGKYLFDFFVVARGPCLLLDCERDRRDALVGRLGLYKLRADVTISPAGDSLKVAAIFGDGAGEALGLGSGPGAARETGGGVLFRDPRLAALGARAILAVDREATLRGKIGAGAAPFEDYERLRLGLGIPDGSRDIQVEKSFLLEGNFDALNGVDFAKGCFIGQELTARTKHRGNLRKRLLPVTLEGPLPPPGTPVRLGDREVGVLRSGLGDRAIALLRIDAVAGAAEDTPLVAGATRLRPFKPDWMEPTWRPETT